MSQGPGRSCPLHYRYGAAALAVPAEAECETVYVVGGLYGNPFALDTVLALFEREASTDKRLVFNGDFHWFDIDAHIFTDINRRVLAFDALRGNVETELADGNADDLANTSGCGCGYPDWVGDAIVDHSNHIMQRLRATARTAGLAYPAIRQGLAALPMWRRIDVGGQGVAIVHGDAQSLAGWGFAQEHLRDPAHRELVTTWFDAARVDIFASSHTCLPVFMAFGRGAVLNNGAAGMPNFQNDRAGLLTRISTRPFLGPERRYGLKRNGLHLDAIAIDCDFARWHAMFERQWPPGSHAHLSYGKRISAGPPYSVAEAWQA